MVLIKLLFNIITFIIIIITNIVDINRIIIIIIYISIIIVAIIVDIKQIILIIIIINIVDSIQISIIDIVYIISK